MVIDKYIREKCPGKQLGPNILTELCIFTSRLPFWIPCLTILARSTRFIFPP